jgi:hypothetical protein
MKVLFRLNQTGQYLAFFLKNGELIQYSANQETSCSTGFFQRTLHLTDLHRVSPTFKDFLNEVSQRYGFFEIKHSLEKLKDG